MPYRSAIEKLKSGQVLVRTRGTENASQLWQGGSLETAKGAFTGGDVLLQSCALHASNHKKRTGFGPQQASFGVLRLRRFGGYVRSSEFRYHCWQNRGSNQTEFCFRLATRPENIPRQG